MLLADIDIEMSLTLYSFVVSRDTHSVYGPIAKNTGRPCLIWKYG